MIRTIVLFLCLFFSCSNNPNLVRDFDESKELPVELLREVEILHTEKGKLKVKIFSNQIKRFNNQVPQIILSDKVKVIFYNDLTEVKSTLTAENASIDENQKIMIAKKNVVLISSDDKKLETEELIWDNNLDKIYSQKEVKITTKKNIVLGKGFDSTPDFKKYSIENIQGIFNINTN